MPTTGGNAVFANSHPASDATVIQRLREAARSSSSRPTWTKWPGHCRSQHGGGQILNPYDLTKGPGGSSGGTGVAVAAGFATVGLGTETGVSVRSPASNNMLVASSIARPGEPRRRDSDFVYAGSHWRPWRRQWPMRRSADAMRGFDADDLTTTENFARPVPNYTTWWSTGLRGKRVGVLRECSAKGMWCRPATR